MTTVADVGSTSQTAAAAAASSQQRQQDKMGDAAAEISAPPSSPLLPRVTIQFCTQCKWMLRAAYVSLCNSAFPRNSIRARAGRGG